MIEQQQIWYTHTCGYTSGVYVKKRDKDLRKDICYCMSVLDAAIQLQIGDNVGLGVIQGGALLDKNVAWVQESVDAFLWLMAYVEGMLYRHNNDYGWWNHKLQYRKYFGCIPYGDMMFPPYDGLKGKFQKMIEEDMPYLHVIRLAWLELPKASMLMYPPWAVHHAREYDKVEDIEELSFDCDYVPDLNDIKEAEDAAGELNFDGD